jgi:hypothetical protein
LEDRIDAGFDDTIPADALGEPEGPAALDSDGKVEADQASAKIISVTGNKTLALTDAGTMQYVNSASAISVTIPTNASAAFPLGTDIEIYRVGSGTVTLGVTSLTIQCWDSGRTVAVRYTSVVIRSLQQTPGAFRGTWVILCA